MVINFLARFLHLDGITAKIRAAIQKLRAKVDGMLDKVAGWIADKAKKLGKFVTQAGVPQDPHERLRLAMRVAKPLVRAIPGRPIPSLVERVLAPVKVRYGLTLASGFVRGRTWWIRLVINPEESDDAGKADSPEVPRSLRRRHDQFRSAAANVGKEWSRRQVQRALADNPSEKIRLSALKAQLDAGQDPTKEPLAGFNKLTAGSDLGKTTDDLESQYAALIIAAQTLQDGLGDLTMTPQQRARIEADLRRQIQAGALHADQAFSQPEVQRILLLTPDLQKLRASLQTGLTDVNARIAADAATPKSIVELRVDFAISDHLRQEADRAVRQLDENKRVAPYIKSVEEIIKSTGPGEREDADEGDGSSEAAAIKESQTGKQIKGRWHGQKCHMEKLGIDRAVISLEAILPSLIDPSLNAKVQGVIARGKARSNGLKKGADAWKNSPFFHLAPF